MGTTFLAVLALLHHSALSVQHVRIPEPGGVVLDAALVRPAGPVLAPAVVALHGCGGPVPSRDAQWAEALAGQGHIVLLPDSFGSRGLGSQCRVVACRAAWDTAGRDRPPGLVEWWGHGAVHRSRSVRPADGAVLTVCRLLPRMQDRIGKHKLEARRAFDDPGRRQG